MSYYAISMSLMAMGIAAAGSFSGYLQQLLGYPSFFGWILVSSALVYGLSIVTVKRDKTLTT